MLKLLLAYMYLNYYVYFILHLYPSPALLKVFVEKGPRMFLGVLSSHELMSRSERFKAVQFY